MTYCTWTVFPILRTQPVPVSGWHGGVDACFYLQSHTETGDVFVFYLILLSYSLSSLAPVFPQGGLADWQ